MANAAHIVKVLLAFKQSARISFGKVISERKLES